MVCLISGLMAAEQTTENFHHAHSTHFDSSKVKSDKSGKKKECKLARLAMDIPLLNNELFSYILHVWHEFHIFPNAPSSGNWKNLNVLCFLEGFDAAVP